jgi:F0F1-type ATP synthase assembly protein I
MPPRRRREGNTDLIDKETEMIKNETNPKKARFSIMGAAMGLGLLVGGILGLLVDNLAFSAGGGMVLGLAIGTALENRRVKK